MCILKHMILIHSLNIKNQFKFEKLIMNSYSQIYKYFGHPSIVLDENQKEILVHKCLICENKASDGTVKTVRTPKSVTSI